MSPSAFVKVSSSSRVRKRPAGQVCIGEAFSKLAKYERDSGKWKMLTRNIYNKYISAVKVNALMQINFNGTNFIDLLIFTNLINIADPLVIFSLQKSAQTWPFSPSKKQSLRIAGTAAWAQGLAVHSQRAHTPLSLSLSVRQLG